MRDSAWLLLCVAIGGCNHGALSAVDSDRVMGIDVYNSRPFWTDDSVLIDFTPAPDACLLPERGTCRTFDGCIPAAKDGRTAGEIALSGLSQPVRLTPTAQGYRGSWDLKTPLAAGGETMVLTATGGDIPAFTATLPTPRALTVRTTYRPPVDGTDWIPYERAQDLVFRWDPDAGAGDLDAWLGSPGHPQSVRCRFAGDAGSGVMPHALVENLPPGEGLLDIHNQFLTTVDAGRWHVPVSASRMAVDVNGKGMVQIFDFR